MNPNNETTTTKRGRKPSDTMRQPIKETMRRDCVMFKELPGAQCICTGLISVFCASEDCKFYKKRG